MLTCCGPSGNPRDKPRPAGAQATPHLGSCPDFGLPPGEAGTGRSPTAVASARRGLAMCEIAAAAGLGATRLHQILKSMGSA